MINNLIEGNRRNKWWQSVDSMHVDIDIDRVNIDAITRDLRLRVNCNWMHFGHCKCDSWFEFVMTLEN